jgi:hypothetical protein
MHPFLLAFVDSDAFKFMMWALLIGAVVVAIGWFLAFFWGARFVLQRWRQLRSAVTRRERFRAAAQLLAPLLAIGVWLLYRLGTTHYEAKRQSERRAEAQHIVDSLRTASIGVYKLVDDGQLTIRAMVPKSIQVHKLGHTVADTAFVAEKSAAASVELVLRADSTFQYRSNIVGDATGATQQGMWKVECLFCFGTPAGSPMLYQPYFSIVNQYSGQYESTSTLISFYEKRKLRFMGSCNQQGRLMRFELKK